MSTGYDKLEQAMTKNPCPPFCSICGERVSGCQDDADACVCVLCTVKDYFEEQL